MKIYFIRHGETTGDVEDRFGGAYDDSLSPRGEEQSRALAEELKDSGIEAIYASSLTRAQETASFLAEATGAPVAVVDGLKERNQYGFLSGMKKSEAKEKHADLVEALKSRHTTAEGGETYEASSERVAQAFKKVVEEAEAKQYKTIAIISHGGPLRILFRDILKWGEIKDIGDLLLLVNVPESPAFGPGVNGTNKIEPRWRHPQLAKNPWFSAKNALRSWQRVLYALLEKQSNTFTLAKAQRFTLIKDT